MAWKYETLVCNSCGLMQTVKTKRPNHILHIILSVITLGVWLIVYAAAGVEAVFARKPRCCNCGKKMK